MNTENKDKNTLTNESGKQDVFSMSEMLLVLLITAFIFICGFLGFKAASDHALITDNANAVARITCPYLSVTVA